MRSQKITCKYAYQHAKLKKSRQLTVQPCSKSSPVLLRICACPHCALRTVTRKLATSEPQTRMPITATSCKVLCLCWSLVRACAGDLCCLCWSFVLLALELCAARAGGCATCA